jgi:hypothetical protein
MKRTRVQSPFRSSWDANRSERERSPEVAGAGARVGAIPQLARSAAAGAAGRVLRPAHHPPA